MSNDLATLRLHSDFKMSDDTAFIRYEIDRHLGCTPCVCGDTETWHPECYKGKSPRQIQNAYKRVYKYLLGTLKLRLKP